MRFLGQNLASCHAVAGTLLHNYLISLGTPVGTGVAL